MVDCVLDGGWTIEAAAEWFQIDAKTVTKWRDRLVGSHVEAEAFTQCDRTADVCLGHRATQTVSAGSITATGQQRHQFVVINATGPAS